MNSGPRQILQFAMRTPFCSINDLASFDRLSAIEQQIRHVKEGARIVRTTRCRVPLALILSVGSFQSDRYASDHLDRDHGHLTNDGFEALSFEAELPFAADRFQRFFAGAFSQRISRQRRIVDCRKQRTACVSSRRPTLHSGRKSVARANEKPTGADRPQPRP
jgi:G3E family GTPase